MAQKTFKAYQDKTMEVIDCCVRGCCLFYDPVSPALQKIAMHRRNAHRSYCPKCGEHRYGLIIPFLEL